MLTLPRNLAPLWEQARRESAEAGQQLWLHFGSAQEGGEFLFVQESLWQLAPSRYPVAADVLSVGGAPGAWLLVNWALTRGPARRAAPARAAHAPTALWTGPTPGLAFCFPNVFVPHAWVNGHAQDGRADPNHIRFLLAGAPSLDRAQWENAFRWPQAERFEADATTHAPRAWFAAGGPEVDAGAAAGWMGVLGAALLLLAGGTRFLLGFF